jgi:cytoskeleton protein RodZ
MVDDVITEAELPLEGVGARLMRAREAAGLSRAQVAATTKIPERHLASIEAGDFAALPASTYAIGFSRSYARAVDLNPDEVAADVRAELAAIEPEAPRRSTPSFEPGDPARVPSAKFAWLAALAAVILLVAGFSWWRGYFAPGGDLPSILPDDAPAASAAASAAPSAATGPVVFTALAPQVWVKFSDGAGNQLFQKELAQGESYTVPADAADVRLMTARPNQLAITIGGQPVAKVSEIETVVRNVPVTAAALQARGGPAAAASGTASGAAALAPSSPAARSAPAERNQRSQNSPAPTGRDRGAVAPEPQQRQMPPTEAIPALTPAAEPAPPANQTADR